MALSISAWTGDNGGAVLGRSTNSLLVTVNQPDQLDLQSLTFQANTPFSSPWYAGLNVDCLNALSNSGGPFQFPPYPAIVIGCTQMPRLLPGRSSWYDNVGIARQSSCFVYLIELAQFQFVDFNAGPLSPWRPGVALFSFSINNLSTIATAVIDSEIPTLTLNPLELPG
jgi:hypothetical protein